MNPNIAANQHACPRVIAELRARFLTRDSSCPAADQMSPQLGDEREEQPLLVGGDVRVMN